ncbi:monocarboxylate transporter 5-like [Acanthaster planci]|uniref:Monocarboxylate transporter 5-like n=1 Tax=Acanthaster planci TaxID=133434 RepID=A0A8B7YDX6_ACAPL|nr:monocarboxylate transporter 5-like [Acanthaster planci]
MSAIRFPRRVRASLVDALQSEYPSRIRHSIVEAMASKYPRRVRNSVAEAINSEKLQVKNRWGWLVTFCTFLIILPVTGILSAFGVIFVKLQKEFQISDLAVGWIGSLAFGIMFAASPFSTCLFKRFGHRVVTIIGVLLCSGGLLLSSFMPDPHLLFLTYSLLFGVGSNFIDNTSLNLVGAYFPRKNSARSTCFATLGWSVGSLALNPGLEFLSDEVGWRNTFRICSGALFVIGMISALTFRPPPQKYSDMIAKMERERQLQKLMRKESNACAGEASSKAVADGDGEEKSGNSGESCSGQGSEYQPIGQDQKHTLKQNLRSFARAFKAPGFVLWFTANIVMNISLIFPFVNMIKFMTTIGITEEEGSFVLTIVGTADLGGRLGSAFFGDHLPVKSVYVYPVCSTIMAAATFCLLLINSLTGMYAFSIVIGICTGVVNSMLFKAVMDMYGSNLVAESWTFTLLAAGVGISVGPTVAGAAYDYTQKFDIAFYVGGAMFVLASVLTLAIPFVQRYKGWVPQVITKNDSSSSMTTTSIETVDTGEEIVKECVWVA